MIRAVVDTNVLVSGTRNRHGNEARVIDLIRGGDVIACLSEQIFGEYVDVLARSKFSFPVAEVADLLSMLRRAGMFFHVAAEVLDVPDPSDIKFMRCAIAAQADYLITGNRRHFPDAFYGTARVVNGREFLALIDKPD